MASRWIRWVVLFGAAAAAAAAGGLWLWLPTRAGGGRPTPQAAVEPPALPGSPVPAGSLFARRADFTFAIFHLPRPRQAPRPTVEALLKSSHPELALAPGPAKDPTRPAVEVEELATSTYPPPDNIRMELGGRGLSNEDKERLLDSERVTVLRFHTAPPALDAMKQALLLAREVADATGGLLWDEGSGELFTSAAWTQRRLDTWDRGLPRVSGHFAIQSWQEEDRGRRLVTAGLGKFGLPDLVVLDPPKSLIQPLGSLINCAAQALLEQGALPEEGRFTLDLEALEHEPYRKTVLKSTLANAKRKVALRLVVAERQEGDPENRLVQLLFPGEPSHSESERQNAAVDQLLGSHDSTEHVPPSEELLAASRRAVQRLRTELKPRFQRGLAPGERLMVKAPFETSSGGDEYMWLEVTGWKDDGVVQGVLANEPEDVPDLRPGSPVEVEEVSLFDYMLYLPDGSVEGNETGKIIAREAREEQ